MVRGMGERAGLGGRGLGENLMVRESGERGRINML